MKNNFKKYLLFVIILSITTILLFIFVTCLSIKKYDYNNNVIMSTIINNVKNEYPNIDENKIIELLNSKKLNDSDILKQYGIYVQDSSISLANKEIVKNIVLINGIVIVIYFGSIVLLFYFYNKKNESNIREITNYLIKINEQDYKLDILSNSEDELSILKNELYKTAIMLNENSINLKKEKDSLKDSLSDISHQLKTPLTSINLMIDNLLENNNLNESKQKELLINIHRKINNINFLIQSLLKLSRFDANTIVFTKKSVKIDKIISEVIDNLAAICDLKSVVIDVQGNKKDIIICDYKWQVEALTNIVKNCVEYSNNSSKIEIKYESNDIFTKIVIRDYGKGISKEDLKHIFERFYKGENSATDSIGIGLALAKTIIEKDNGKIIVESEENKGTIFTIKYFY